MIANTPALPATVSKPVFIDEFWRVTQSHGLTMQIRSLPAIPNATYLVKNGRVFVFDYLVQRVTNEKIDPAKQPDLVARLVDECWVKPLEAVQRWRIKPGAYSIAPSGEDYAIVHTAFDAFIPVTFASELEAQEAMAQLLVGRTIACEGEFSYEHQGLVSRVRQSTPLPAKPAFDLGQVASVTVYNWFDVGGFEPGFALLDADRYAQFGELMAQWSEDNHHLTQIAQDNLSLIWPRLLELSIVTLPVQPPELDADDQDTANQLQGLYPELQGLTSAQLYQLFEDFSEGPLGSMGWNPERTDSFGLFLLGKLVERAHGGEASVVTGGYAWFALLRGDSPEQAYAFAHGCQTYDDALTAHAWYLTGAMSFLRKMRHHQTLLKTDRLLVDGLERRGDEVRVFTDSLTDGRKIKIE
jgi:hypothetical protein